MKKLPKNLKYEIKPGNAIKGNRLVAIANKITSGRRNHGGAGGTGQFAVIKKGVCWIEEPSDNINLKR